MTVYQYKITALVSDSTTMIINLFTPKDMDNVLEKELYVNELLEQVIRDRESVGFSHPPPPEELNLSNKSSKVDKTPGSPLVPKQTISTNVNNDVLQQILDRLNTIEELLRKK